MIVKCIQYKAKHRLISIKQNSTFKAHTCKTYWSLLLFLYIPFPEHPQLSKSNQQPQRVVYPGILSFNTL